MLQVYIMPRLRWWLMRESTITFRVGDPQGHWLILRVRYVGRMFQSLADVEKEGWGWRELKPSNPSAEQSTIETPHWRFVYGDSRLQLLEALG